jgi:class 3 adenylate cyclase/WD40 repeat protein
MTAPSRPAHARGAATAPTPPPQSLTFVFTDIEGSTRLLEELRDRYADVLAIHGRLIGEAVARAGGELVDTQGDAFFLVFPTVDQAVAFAVDAQRALADQRWPADTGLRVRMGIHSGEATANAGGYVGLDVHRAARISSAAHGGQVLLSAEAAHGLGNGSGVKALGQHQLKDFKAPIELHQLVIDGLPAEFPPPRVMDDPDQPPAEGEPPYQGLAHFEEEDAKRFFGREKLVERLVARLAEQPFLAVIGASGSGKSSVVRAGLIPALREKGVKRVVLLTPTAEPFAALAAALLPDAGSAERDELAQLLRYAPVALAEHFGPGSLLVVDQAEELFSLTRDEAERAAFIERLLAATEAGGYVVLTLRADFYDRLAGYPELRDLVAARQEYLGQMSADELRAAIEGPAQAGGWRFDAGLVDLILHDVGTEPGALPLLSHALLETWQRRRGRLMMLRGYLESGGVQAAIARSADRLMAELQPDQQLIARTIFLRLTEFGAGTPDTRRRAGLTELVGQTDGAAAAAVLQRLAEHRLVVLGEDTAEVAHEALIREWPTLREWLAADREALRLHRSLTEAATDWQRANREPSLLFRGARLAAALDWAPGHEAELNDLERDFLEESRLASEREAQHQRTINRRLRFLLAGAGVFLVLAIGAGAYAALEANRAEQEAAIARSRELTASAINVLADDPLLSKLLAMSALTVVPDPLIETMSVLHRALAADPTVGRYEWPAEQLVNELWVDVDPSGQLAVAAEGFWAIPGGRATYIEVRELSTDEVRWQHQYEAGHVVHTPLFARDGVVVVAGITLRGAPAPIGEDETLGLQVWDASSGEIVGQFDLGPCGGTVEGAADARVLVKSLPSPSGDCWDASEGVDQVLLEVIDLTSGARTVLSNSVGQGRAVIAADGRRAAFEDLSGPTPVWLVVDIDSGERLPALGPSPTQMDFGARALNADGTLLVYGDRPLHVYEVESGDYRAAYGDHLGATHHASFSVDGESVYSVGRDGSLRHWDAGTGATIGAYPTVGFGRVVPLTDDSVLVTDTQRKVGWPLDTGVRGEVGFIRTCEGFVVATTLTLVDGVAAVNQDCRDDTWPTFVLDVASRTSIKSWPRNTGQALSMAPDGTRLVRQAADLIEGAPEGEINKSPEIIDIQTEARLVLQGVCHWDTRPSDPPWLQPGCSQFPQQPFPMWVGVFAWSPDGSMVAAVNDYVTGGVAFFVVWDAQSGVVLHSGIRDRGAASEWMSAIFSADSKRLIMSYAGHPGGMAAYDVDTWELVKDVPLDEIDDTLRPIGLSADGRTLYAWDGLSMFWIDAESLEITGRPIERTHDGTPKATAVSPDGSFIATGASDGFVRVWSTDDRSLVHEISIGKVEAQGVAFVSNQHLAVAPATGHVFIYTLDPVELVDIARQSLHRGLTADECQRYNFGDECPTLDELRAP